MVKTLVHVQQGLVVGAHEGIHDPSEPLQLGVGPALRLERASELFAHLRTHLAETRLAEDCELITERERLPIVSQPHTLIRIAGYNGLKGATIGDKSSVLTDFTRAKLVSMGYEVKADDIFYPTKSHHGLFVVQRY